MTVHGYIGLGMMGSAMCERLARAVPPCSPMT